MADNEFTQLIKGLQGERLRQAFRYFDKDGDGYILPTEFQKIIMVRQSSSKTVLTHPRRLQATSFPSPSSNACLLSAP